MFYRNTINSINRLEYKLLFEVACEQAGYTFVIASPAHFKIKKNTDEDAPVYRWAYQTLRWMPISSLYYYTGVTDDLTSGSMAQAIRAFFSLDPYNLKKILQQNEIKLDARDERYLEQHLSVMQNKLIPKIELAVNRMIPQLGNGENILSIYTYTAQLRNGVRQRYRAENKELIKENPWLLDALELDFHEWFRSVNIDPERQDTYVAENVIGAYMGNYFFKEWNDRNKPVYLGSTQRIMYSGEYLDVQNTEVVQLPDVPQIDFHQTMSDVVQLSRELFSHATASRRGDYIVLQYSVLEWYVNKYLKQTLNELNHVYKAILNGNTSNLQKEAMKESSVYSYLALNTEFQVNRRPRNTVDNALLTRIGVNQNFLDRMHSAYKQISISNLTSSINSKVLERAATSKDGKSDSNYPFFREGQDISIPGDDLRSDYLFEILDAKYPNLEIKKRIKQGVPREQIIAYLTLNKASIVITDAGYEKFALVIRCMQELDELNNFLLEHGMSVADLNSVSVLTPEYFEIVQDLSGVLYDKLSNPWRESHSGAQGDLWDGIEARVLTYITNSDVREMLSKPTMEAGDYHVDINTIKDKAIERPLKRAKKVKEIKYLRPIFSKEDIRGVVYCNILSQLHRVAYPKVYVGEYITEADVYQDGRSKDPTDAIRDHIYRHIHPWDPNSIVTTMGNFAILLNILYKLIPSGSRSGTPQILSDLRSTEIARIQPKLERLGVSWKIIRDTLVRMNLSLLPAITDETKRLDDDYRLEGLVQVTSKAFEMGQRIMKVATNSQGTCDLQGWGMVLGDLIVRTTGMYDSRQGRELIRSEVDKKFNDWTVNDKISKIIAVESGITSKMVNRIMEVQREKGVAQEGIKKVLGVITFMYCYYIMLHEVSSTVLDIYSPQWEGIHWEGGSCKYWAIKDALHAKILAYNLRSSFQARYINPINKMLEVYNTYQSMGNGTVYRTYVSLAVVDLKGMFLEMKANIIQIEDLYRKLRSGVDEESYLADMDELKIEYPINILSSHRMDSKYPRELYSILLQDVVIRSRNSGLVADIDSLLNEIQNMQDSLKKRLCPKADIARGLHSDMFMKVVESRLRAITKDSNNPLYRKYLFMCIQVGRDSETQNKMRQFFGASSEHLVTDALGFIKNHEGQYYCAKPTTDSVMFMHRSGVAFLCDIEFDAEDQGVTLIAVTELDNGIVWE